MKDAWWVFGENIRLALVKTRCKTLCQQVKLWELSARKVLNTFEQFGCFIQSTEFCTPLYVVLLLMLA